jgi:hypothetical protein
MLHPIYTNLQDLINDEIKDRYGIELSDILNPRLTGDIVRELVAHAILRTAHQITMTIFQN